MATKVKKAAVRQMTAQEQAEENANKLLALRGHLKELSEEVTEVETALQEYVEATGAEEIGDLTVYRHKGTATLKGASGKALDIFKAQLISEFPELAETKLNVTTMEGLLGANIHMANSLKAKQLYINRSEKIAFKEKA